MIDKVLRYAIQRMDDLRYEEEEARKLRMRLETAEQTVAIRRKAFDRALLDLQILLNAGQR